MKLKATFGGGCFWCMDAVFRRVKGVERVTCGYSGGETSNPTYEDVCSDKTGHAEVVQIEFDPDLISYRELLEIFFSVHDPTTLNRQGNDIGTQYRSIILYHDKAQKEVAEEVIRSIEQKNGWKGKIVTELKKFEVFYRAEEYHQNYFEKNPHQAYCSVVIAPKISKLENHFKYMLK